MLFDCRYRDLSLGPQRVGTFLGKAAECDYPRLMAWVAGIAARPAVVRALAAVDDVRTKTTQFSEANAEAMDRLFGRGKHNVAA
jgi:GSH-dependent disulfide-bond oxidoreductase